MDNLMIEVKLGDLISLRSEIDELVAENKKLTDTNDHLHKMNMMNYFEKKNFYLTTFFSHLDALNQKNGEYCDIYNCCNFIRLNGVVIKDRDCNGPNTVSDFSAKIKFNDLDMYNKTLIVEKYCNNIKMG